MPMLEYIGGEPPIGKEHVVVHSDETGQHCVTIEIQNLSIRRDLCVALARLTESFPSLMTMV